MKEKELLIAVFLGWCGGYQFYKKRSGIGVLYFFTFGLFGIGWILDIISAATGNDIYKANSKKSPITNLPLKEVTRFNSKVVGVTFESKCRNTRNRQDIIWSMKKSDILYIEKYKYDDEPACLVRIKRTGEDI